MKIYRTIQEDASSLKTETVYEIQKSRFLTHLAHVESEAEARTFLQTVKKRFYDARHNCSAYVIGTEQRTEKTQDDGEPGGTAGLPILSAIKAQKLTNIIVVVTRYFGGIKLGAGGLIRAYSHSAALGIKNASIIEMRPQQEIFLKLQYDLLAKIERWIHTNDIRTGEYVYAENVTIPLLLEPLEVEKYISELRDLTSARFEVRDGIMRYYGIPVVGKEE